MIRLAIAAESFNMIRHSRHYRTWFVYIEPFLPFERIIYHFSFSSSPSSVLKPEAGSVIHFERAASSRDTQ